MGWTLRPSRCRRRNRAQQRRQSQPALVVLGIQGVHGEPRCRQSCCCEVSGCRRRRQLCPSLSSTVLFFAVLLFLLCREERNITKRAIPLLKEVAQSIRNAAIEGEPAYVASILSVGSCEGNVTLVINRGKARPGFELEVKCDWALAAPSASSTEASSSPSPSLASGTIHIPEMSDSDGAAIFSSFQCTCTEAQAPLDKAKAKALMSDVVKKVLREKLREWVESVKAL
jgi:hypothetical protein